MKRKSELSGTSSGKRSETSTDDFTIYDVPGANLDIRGIAYALLKRPEPEVQAEAQRIIDLATRCIRAMGREDAGVLAVVEDKEEVA